MQLIDIRTEVLNCGFDPTLFGSSRINAYINNGYFNMVRRVSYYVDEATQDYSTVSGTSMYSLPADFAKVRSLRRTDIGRELQSVFLRDIDRSIITSGTPYAYALDGANMHLYPTPDQAYPLELRYWKLPAALSADTDVPTIPADYHNLLIYSAVAEGYRAEIGQMSDLNAQSILQARQASTLAFAFTESSALSPGQGCSEISNTTPSGPWNLVS